MFGTEGYEAASMNAVAAAAGVSKGLLHYHFQSKEHLLIEAQRATFRQMHERFEERFAQGDKGMDTALDALDNLWDSLFSMRHWAPFMVETISLAAQQSPIRKAADAFYSESMSLLDSGLRAVFEGEEDRLVIPPERLGAMVRVCVHGFIVELAYARNEEELEAAHRTYKDFRQLFGTWMLGDAIPEQEDAR
ncbi:MAG: TetR/AcrR family transcriptional regulator [Proteobacteria bacterium]|nr:TetR/AcrR family transcriptional regulator [Pseudomonadota bacterium]